jgi:hypothetical protein
LQLSVAARTRRGYFCLLAASAAPAYQKLDVVEPKGTASFSRCNVAEI